MLKLEDSSIEIPVLSYILWEVSFGMKYSYSDCFIFNVFFRQKSSFNVGNCLCGEYGC